MAATTGNFSDNKVGFAKNVSAENSKIPWELNEKQTWIKWEESTDVSLYFAKINNNKHTDKNYSALLNIFRRCCYHVKMIVEFFVNCESN